MLFGFLIVLFNILGEKIDWILFRREDMEELLMCVY